jgi:hypothetical protein
MHPSQKKGKLMAGFLYSPNSGKFSNAYGRILALAVSGKTPPDGGAFSDCLVDLWRLPRAVYHWQIPLKATPWHQLAGFGGRGFGIGFGGFWFFARQQ